MKNSRDIIHDEKLNNDAGLRRSVFRLFVKPLLNVDIF